MNVAHFRLTYDGPALAKGEMDVRELAPALLSAADLLKAANAALFGDQSEVRINVRGSFKTGSFGIDLALMQDFLRSVRDIFAGPEATAAANATALLSVVGVAGGGLIGALRKLQRRPVTRVEDAEGGKILHVDQDTIYVEQNVYLLLQDRPTREHLDAILKPLDRDGIEQLAFGTDDRIDEVIEQTERAWFSAPLQDETPLFESASRVALTIESAVFKEGNKWRFSDGTASFWAEIKDVEFLSRIETGEERFGKGDQLIVELNRAQFEVEGKLRTDYSVLTVIEHRAPPQRVLL